MAWNDGLGAFMEATFPIEPGAQDVRFGELDGDGWLDMAAGLVDWQSVRMEGTGSRPRSDPTGD